MLDYQLKIDANSELLDGVEDILIKNLDDVANGADVVPYEFSGRY